MTVIVPVPVSLQPKYAGEAVTYCFDFSEAPEVAYDAQTISGPTVAEVGSSDLTIGPPAVLTTPFYDADGYAVAAGKGVSVLVSGGAAGTDYLLACAVTTSGGATRIVEGRLAVQ